MQLAEIVYARASYEDVYEAICNTAVEAIPGCDHACVSSLRAGGELTCEGASDEVAALIDSFERKTGEGPCLDAILDSSYQHDPDITTHATWPELTKLVLAHTPVRGMIGYRLLIGDRKAGALNIFSGSSSPDSCSTFRWWLIVGWDRSKAGVRSHTHASPPSWESTIDISRSRTGSARALSSGATWSACSSLIGSRDSGVQQASTSLVRTGSSREIDTCLC